VLGIRFFTWRREHTEGTFFWAREKGWPHPTMCFSKRHFIYQL
jgi:hypothetical protein